MAVQTKKRTNNQVQVRNQTREQKAENKIFTPNVKYLIFSALFIICSIIILGDSFSNPQNAYTIWIMNVQYVLAFFVVPFLWLRRKVNWKSALYLFTGIMAVGDLAQSIVFYVVLNNPTMGGLKLGFVLVDLVMLALILWFINKSIKIAGGDPTKHKAKWNFQKRG